MKMSLVEILKENMPERTCIGCRKKAEHSTMVRWTYRIPPQEEAPDSVAVQRLDCVYASLSIPGVERSGRGAWMHPRRSCFTIAHKKGKFQRSLRIGSNIPVDEESFFALIHE